MNLVNRLICAFLIMTLISCKGREPNDLEGNIIQTIKKANNDRDYDVLKPLLSNKFHLEGSDIKSSFTSLYSYLNFSLSEKITRIEINGVNQLNDSVFVIKGTKYYENYKADKLEIEYSTTGDKPKILMINSVKPNKFPLTTRASYVDEEIFGNDPVSNIKNLIILDKSKADSISKTGYTVYYDDQLRKESEITLQLFSSLDSLLTTRFNVTDIERESIYLTTVNSKNTITIGKNRKIPWTIALNEEYRININNLTHKIGNTFSHEIIEGTLVQKYNLKGYEYRWFRDGLSDYMAYLYCKIIAPEIAENYFIDQRLSSASKFSKNGNLLDWRGNGPIDAVDKGKLYGERFIYYNEVGQYGRAFRFFKEQFEENEEYLVEILGSIKNDNNISMANLLRIMSDVTNKNIVEIISSY